MAFKHSKDLQVFINQFNLSSYFRSVSTDYAQAMNDATTFGQTAPTVFPGLRNGSIAVEGLFDQTATVGSNTVLQSLKNLATAPIVTVAEYGTAIGSEIAMIQAFQQNYRLNSKVGDLVMNAADFQSNDGGDFGVSLHLSAAETASTNSTSVDNSVSSSNGGVAFLHCTAISGAPSVVIKVQHSTNNSTWVDLVTFATLSASTSSERVVVAAGTTVNRYLRAMSTVTGGTTPSITYTAGFARR